MYQRGYHVEWRKRTLSKNSETTSRESDVTVHPTSAPNEFLQTSSEIPEPVQQIDSVVREDSHFFHSVTRSIVPKTIIQPKHLKKTKLLKPHPPGRRYTMSSGPGPALVTIILLAALVYLMYTIFNILFITAESAFVAALPYILLATLILAIIIVIFIREDWV